MKGLSISITADYTCDACGVETAETNGPLPSGWKEILKPEPSVLGVIRVRKFIGPTCLASNADVDLKNIRDLVAQ